MLLTMNKGKPNEVEYETNDLELILLLQKPVPLSRPGFFVPVEIKRIYKVNDEYYLFIHSYNNKHDVFDMTQAEAMKMCRDHGYGLHQMQKFFPSLNYRRQASA